MFLTRAPLYSPRKAFSLDLHVLSVPLTFVLSQDQTLQFKPVFKKLILQRLSFPNQRTRFIVVLTFYCQPTDPRDFSRSHRIQFSRTEGKAFRRSRLGR